MKISSKHKDVLLVVIVLMVALVIGLVFPFPDTYSYKSEYTPTSINYVSLTKNSVWNFTIIPWCGPREGIPSEGFGAAWVVCHKRNLSILQIESVLEEDGVKTYELKYSTPDEEGNYRWETLVQDAETVVYNKSTYTKSSFVVGFLRYLFGV